MALWSHYPGGGKSVAFVRVGTLNEPWRLPPDIHIYISTKQPWMTLPPDVPAVQEFYDIEQVWSPASLERHAALRAARRS